MLNVSHRLSLAVALCAAVAAALLLLSAPDARTVFAVIFAVIAGASLAFALVKITRPATPFPSS